MQKLVILFIVWFFAFSVTVTTTVPVSATEMPAEIKALEQKRKSLETQEHILETSTVKGGLGCFSNGQLIDSNEGCEAAAELYRQSAKSYNDSLVQLKQNKQANACSLQKGPQQQAKDMSIVLKKVSCDNQPIFSGTCAKAAACNVARTMDTLNTHGLNRIFESPTKVPNSCMDLKQGDCAEKFALGILDNIWGTIKDVAKLALSGAKAGFAKAKADITYTLSWASGDALENKESDKALLGYQTTNREVASAKVSMKEFVTNKVKQIFSEANEAISKYLGEKFICADCNTRINAVCTVLGYLGGEAVQFLTGEAAFGYISKSAKFAKAMEVVGAQLPKFTQVTELSVRVGEATGETLSRVSTSWLGKAASTTAKNADKILFHAPSKIMQVSSEGGKKFFKALDEFGKVGRDFGESIADAGNKWAVKSAAKPLVEESAAATGMLHSKEVGAEKIDISSLTQAHPSVEQVARKTDCDFCSNEIKLTNHSSTHSSQHFSMSRSPEELARSYAETSVLTDTSFDEVVAAVKSYKGKWVPDNKAKEVLAGQIPVDEAKAFGFDAKIKIANEDHVVRVVVCEVPKCVDVNRPNDIFTKGDIVSVFPICGSRVVKVPIVAELLTKAIKPVKCKPRNLNPFLEDL